MGKAGINGLYKKLYDAVLGGENPPLPDSVVLGGIEGVKRRFASKVVEVRIAALRDALNYGDAGLDLVIEAFAYNYRGKNNNK
ncbi:MAG: hypothetical protein AAFX46_18070 [Cyanobacteria bacterium J06636_27]